MPYVQVPENLADVVCRCVRPLVLHMTDTPVGRTMRGRHCARCGGVLTPDDLAQIDAHLRETEQEQG